MIANKSEAQRIKLDSEEPLHANIITFWIAWQCASERDEG